MTKRLLAQMQAPTTAGAAFEAALTTSIDAAAVCNPTGTADTLSVWLVPSGDSATDATAIYSDLPVDTKESISLSLLVNHGMAAGDTIFVKAGSSATALTVTISGRT